MTKPLKVKFSKLDLPATGTAVILASKGPRLAALGNKLDKALDEHLSHVMSVSEFSGEYKTTIRLVPAKSSGLQQILIIGIGDPTALGETEWLNLGGYIACQIEQLSNYRNNAAILAEIMNSNGTRQLDPQQTAWLAEGLCLRHYKFDKYKTKTAARSGTWSEISIRCAAPVSVRKAFAPVRARIEGVFLARDLVNEPANVLGPLEFAWIAKKLTTLGVNVRILKPKEMADLNMNALLAVGQGSTRPPRLVVMEWHGAPDPDAAPLAFVGKGVVFDTGGISIKPGAGMEDMKGDMGGAACVTGLMRVLAGRKAPVNAVGVIGLVENMPDGNAYRPGDVITSMSGQTIEVLNTDAEGRLVLADALWYAQQEYEPEFVINLATLTGAIIVSLGKEYAGLFSNDNDLSQRLTETGTVTGEKVWRMPLSPNYDKLINSNIADMKNIGGRWAGSITAAQFLQRFIKDTPWAHLDIAGMAMAAQKNDVNASWGSGFGVRLLDRLVQEYYQS